MKVPTIPADKLEMYSKMFLIGTLLTGTHDSWVVSDEWNRLLPDYKFTDAEEYITKNWAGIP